MLCLSESSGVVSGAPAGPGGCPVGSYVALSPVEFNHYMVSPFKLSLDDAGQISGAIILLWAVAFGLRTAIRVLRDDSSEISESGD